MKLWDMGILFILIISILSVLGCTEKKEEIVEEQIKNTLAIKIYNNITTLTGVRNMPYGANIMTEIFTGLKKNQWKVNKDVTLDICGQGRTFIINVGIDTYMHGHEVFENDKKLNYAWARDARVLSLKLKDSCKNTKEVIWLDTNATKFNIMQSLTQLETLVKSDDVIVFTYSGFVSFNGHKSQFFTTDTIDYYLGEKSIEYDDVVSILDKLKVKSFILVNGYFFGTGC